MPSVIELLIATFGLPTLALLAVGVLPEVIAVLLERHAQRRVQ